jgi:hypothetical protein
LIQIYYAFYPYLNNYERNVTRSFNVPGTYHIEVTVTDADGKQVKNTNLIFDVSQETPKGDGTANAMPMLHN